MRIQVEEQLRDARKTEEKPSRGVQGNNSEHSTEPTCRTRCITEPPSVLVIMDNFMTSYQMPGKPLNIKSNDFSFAKGLGKYLSWNCKYQRYQAESKNTHANLSSFPNKEHYRNRGFFYMLIKWLYLFWEFPGLSMTVTDPFHKLIYLFNGICGDLCFNSSWLGFFFFFFFPVFLSRPYHIWKISFRHTHLKVARIVRDSQCSKILLVFSAANIPVWDFPCLGYSLVISAVALTKIKIRLQLVPLQERAGEQFSDNCILNAGDFMKALFCLAQYINHNPQFLPKELEWIKLFNKTLLTWINSFLVCI